MEHAVQDGHRVHARLAGNTGVLLSQCGIREKMPMAFLGYHVSCAAGRFQVEVEPVLYHRCLL